MFKILIIEDDLNWLRLFHTFIGNNTKDMFDYNHAIDLKTAIKKLKEDSGFDLILLDLMLPDSHALNTIPTILKEVKNVPVVIISTLDDEKLISEANRNGIKDYLIKDQYDLQTFVRVSRQAIRRFTDRISIEQDFNIILNKLQSFDNMLESVVKNKY
jgi:glutamate dehydrogenase (NAD(P)+)